MAFLSYPEDISSQTQQHWMHIRAFRPGEVNNEDTVTLFVPGGGPNGQLAWKTENDYAEVSLTKVGANVVGVGGYVAVGNMLAQQMGGAINPKVEVLFRTTSLRQFVFGFKFAPSSQEESQAMEDIIKMLRKHAAPELDQNDPNESSVGSIGNLGSYLTSGMYMKAPSEFQIDFYFNGEPNKHLPKIGRCVVQAIEVDYAQDGLYSTFSNGYPVSAFMTIAFREMRIIDKNNIESGY